MVDVAQGFSMQMGDWLETDLEVEAEKILSRLNNQPKMVQMGPFV
jgi:hypothetical protein